MSTVLFSDLDGTILFSKNSLPPKLSIDQCMIVETYPNGQYGYMEIRLIEYLQRWSHHNLFIPVTTRSIEQYERLVPLRKQWQPPFELVSNGGNLYRQGILDHAWNQAVREEIQKELSQKAPILAIIRAEISNENIRKIKEIDQLYYCILVKDSNVTIEIVNQLITKLAKYHWTIYFQSKKWYVLPKQLTKERAVEKLKQEFSEAMIFKALGDTMMDQQMLKEQQEYLYFGKEAAASELLSSEYSIEVIKNLLEKRTNNG